MFRVYDTAVPAHGWRTGCEGLLSGLRVRGATGLRQETAQVGMSRHPNCLGHAARRRHGFVARDNFDRISLGRPVCRGSKCALVPTGRQARFDQRNTRCHSRSSIRSSSSPSQRTVANWCLVKKSVSLVWVRVIGSAYGGFELPDRMVGLYTSDMPGGGMRPAAGELLERTGELARIQQAIDDLGRGRGGVLVIEGVAGIGKTALLGTVALVRRTQGSPFIASGQMASASSANAVASRCRGSTSVASS